MSGHMAVDICCYPGILQYKINPVLCYIVTVISEHLWLFVA